MATKTKTATQSASSGHELEPAREALDPEAAQEAGFFGIRPPHYPDEAYSLQTGPDSPPYPEEVADQGDEQGPGQEGADD